MKRIMTLLLPCVLAVSASASDETQIDVLGAKADSIVSALEDAGAYTDSGIGKSYTVAKDVSCISQGNSVGQPTPYKCTLSAQDETGSVVSITVDKKVSEQLVDALTAAEVPSDCAMGTCGISVSSIDCQGSLAQTSETQCSIVP